MLPSKTQQKKIPYQNAPSVTLGRLAIDKSVQGQGWGEMLVAHAMRWCGERLKPLASTDCLLKPLMRRLKHSIFVWGYTARG
jgi:GNAT superfamily N-acetyltransferase